MTRVKFALLFATAVCLSYVAAETTLSGDERRPAPREPRLRRELLLREKKDQVVRQKLIAFAKQHGLAIDGEELTNRGKHILEEMAKIDAENRRWLKEIVGKSGWPGRTLVSEDGAHAAFLLVQHANRDLALQKHCLRLMQMAPKDDVAAANVALLTDRVRLAEGKKQLYGTQVELRHGRWQVQGEVEEFDKLNERREKVGLPPIEEYLRIVEKFYGTGDNSLKR